jgi:hypothetical protein
MTGATQPQEDVHDTHGSPVAPEVAASILLMLRRSKLSGKSAYLMGWCQLHAP